MEHATLSIMNAEHLHQKLEQLFSERSAQIANIQEKGLVNTHVMGNKDSQSCVTYPPINKLGNQVQNIYNEINHTQNTLYIHIPFCTGICFYCSYKVKKSTEGSDEIDLYLEYLAKELQMILNKLKVKKLSVETVYIGGGTPSILSAKQLNKLLTLIKEKVAVSSEFTLETSPETVTLEKIVLAKDMGVNRVSMGVESWDDQILKNINRRHDKRTAIDAIECFRRADMQDIDIDLIRGLPGQTEKILIEDLLQTHRMEIPSMTNYQYNIKPQSVDSKKQKNYKLSATEITKYASFVFGGMEALGYSSGPPVGWFLKKGNVYRHNHLKWKNQLNQICLGVSSYGYYEGNSFSNTSSMRQYMNLIDRNDLPIVFNSKLSPEEIMRRHFIFSLKSEVDINEFKNKYNHEIMSNYEISSQISYLENLGCLTINHDKVVLTDIGKLFVDQILMTFYSGYYKA